MRFTDALRRADELGLPDRPGSFVQECITKWGGEKPPCCAIGGANCAAGKTRIDVYEKNGWRSDLLTFASRRTFEETGYLDDHRAPDCPRCPSPAVEKDTVTGLVIHLYDDHLLSRTAIADILDAYGFDTEVP